MKVKEYKGKKVSVALKRARDLIADPKHWTQKSFARDKNSKMCDPHSPKADKFCAIGALMAIDGSIYDEARNTLHTVGYIINTNDCYDRRIAHKKVLDHYDKAIELAKAKERNAEASK